ncbi:hypothetical protein DICPUDRAFT_148372 [Dictyostelium purpureum]|uniref:Uncharacterized protein n=1 Tax=Dictyostelium purpureum TaxID=5786 RepID=F0ZAY5_DICPU|nr:uncharacterized protein DICPUDRAFT_148372 [Dictyostelium purpureum]EGC38880.1 hypothetical protein DICPUDRAFT_148372 [Dictyostelium purpureum]|eukprot:XP_003284560.1 hypothetical protein DICPUDRAFT_148372 [Dictyostelium purpureum]
MSYEVLMQENKNHIEEGDVGDKIILLGSNEHYSEIECEIINNCSDNSSDCGSINSINNKFSINNNSTNCINNINNSNYSEEFRNEVSYNNQNFCSHCGNLNKRKKFTNGCSLTRDGDSSGSNGFVTPKGEAVKLTNFISTSTLSSNSTVLSTSPSVIHGHEDDFLNCLILFIAGWLLFLPWLFTYHYLGSPYRKCRVIAIISICLLGLCLILFTFVISLVVILVANPELFGMFQKYWLEKNYNSFR